MIKPAAQLLLTVLLGLLACRPAWCEEKLVLIVSADSKVEQLDSLEVRKLFLGMTVTYDGDRLRPVLNEADAHVKEVFLQNIVSMTDTTYDRRMLRLTLQSGHALPPVYKDEGALINAVALDRLAVSFAWLKDVQHDRRIRIIRVLWHD